MEIWKPNQTAKDSSKKGRDKTESSRANSEIMSVLWPATWSWQSSPRKFAERIGREQITADMAGHVAYLDYNVREGDYINAYQP